MALVHQEGYFVGYETDVPDPTLLCGDELFDFIATYGLIHAVSADPMGATFIEDIDKRLGNHRNAVDLKITGHPEFVDSLLVEYVIKPPAS